MLNWLKSLVGITDIQNRVGLPEQEITLLKKDFAKLDKKAFGISDRILQFLLDDTDEDVLQEILQLKKAGSALKLSCNITVFLAFEGKLARKTFFDTTQCQDAAFWYRLARVYDCASQTEPRHLQCYGLQQEDLEWLEVFLREVIPLNMHIWPPPSDGKLKVKLTAALVQQMVILSEHEAAAFVRAALKTDTTSWAYTIFQDMFLALSGLGVCFGQHPSAVIDVLNQSAHKAKIYVLDMLRQSQTPLDLLVEPLTELAVCSAKTVRAAAEPLILSASQMFRQMLEQKAIEGTATERGHAVKLLWKSAGEECRSFLEQRMEAEKSKKVARNIEQLLTFEALAPQTAEEAPVTPATPEKAFVFPSIEAVEPEAPLPPELKRILQNIVQEHNEQVTEHWKRTPVKYRWGKPPTISARNIDKAFDALQHLVLPKKLAQFKKLLLPDLAPFSYDQNILGMVGDFILRPEVQLIHVVRLCILSGSIRVESKPWQGYNIDAWAHQLFDLYRKEKMPNLDLRTLAVVFTAVGVEERLLAEDVLMASQWLPGFQWEDDAIWPFFAERRHILHDAFELQTSADRMLSYWQKDIRRNAFKVLAAFPQLPDQFASMLWELALGINKSERYEAQACLSTYPDKEPRIVAALTDGKKDVRAAAAEWLGNLNATDAVPQIKKALEKEKREDTKGIMMQALEKLGVPMEQFVNRRRLAEEADKGLKKGIPAKLQWFPLDRLPVVHWEKTRAKVKPEILQWFLIQAFTMKKAIPGPLLRLYCSYFRPDERKAMGTFVLRQWIAEDTKPKYTDAEARDLADKDLQQTLKYVKQYPQYYQEWDEKQYYNSQLQQIRTACLGSAISSKGILAVAAACAGADVVPLVNRYLKDWYGKRAAQCKALIQMLAWIEEPLAIQLLLSVSSRFRTKSIQQEAAQQVEQLAERKGWTADELADRTIPTAGLDEDGTMELDYGERTFSVKLGEDFAIILTNEVGRVLKSLPNARKTEDLDIVKQAKKQFSAAKKELKTVLKLQKERLYEAMCTQRVWHADDWHMYLNQHPIVGRYCQKLVWVAFDGERRVISFRPLPDRSLTNVQDEEVQLEPRYTIRLAHDCLLTEEERNAWLEHFADYEVVPLFPQFGRSPFALSEQQHTSTDISDFVGHLVKAFALRGRATKLGYTRGEAEDAGWFYVYRKNFPGLQLQAVIEFTGNFLPEEDRMVALQHLYFVRTSPEQKAAYSWYAGKVRLQEIPPVLLAECWNDMKTIAAEGPGFDPEWEKKTAY